MVGGIVAPVNVDLIPNYANIFEGLKNKRHNSMDGQPYGVPHGRGPNLLMYNTDVVTDRRPPAGTVVWNGGAEGDGKVSVYDSSIYIADAALHLMTVQPDLGITNPYQLNQAQFDAAVALLEEAARCRRPVLGHLQRPGRVVRGRRRHDRHVLAVPGRPDAGRGSADRRRPPERGLHRLVRHVDDRQGGGAPQLHVPVDEPHGFRRGQRPGHRLVRRGADQPAGLRLRGDRSRPVIAS